MRILAPALAALFLSTTTAMADINVAVSIKPIHSIVSAVMKGMGSPSLIIDGANSPHTYVMKPSDAQKLEQANLVIWVGETLEPSLKKPIETFASDSAQLTLLNIRNLKRWEVREDNIFGEHHDHDHGEEHTDHDHEAEDVKSKSIGAVKQNNGPDYSKTDAHIWLNPDNAAEIARAVSELLQRMDSPNAEIYRANTKTFLADLDALSAEIAATLKDTYNHFIVFHDAYQYFEKKFGIPSEGAIAIHPENPPGAKAIADIRDYIKDKKITCVYAEPQFDPKLVTVITEGTTAKSSVLDPIGASLDPGPKLYFTLLQSLAKNIKGC